MEKRNNNKFGEKEVVEFFDTEIDCGQVVLNYFAKKYEHDKELPMKIASTFGAGIFKGGICGAYTGGLMAIGMIYGHSEPNDTERKVNMIKKLTEYNVKYNEKYESEICDKLLGGDFMNSTKLCPKLVIDVIDIVESLE